MKSDNKRAIGLLSLLGAIILFSTVEIASKVIGARVQPWQMVFLRFFVTGAVLLMLVGRNLPNRLLLLTRRDYGILLLNGFIGIAASISLFHLALLWFKKAASCAVVFSVNPIFVIALAPFINKEPFNWTKFGVVLCGVTGIAFFAWESGKFDIESLKALALICLSALLFAASICISRRVIHRYGVFILMGFTALFGSLMVLPLAVYDLMQTGAAGLISAWLPMSYLVLFGTTLAYGLYYYGLNHCSVFQASMSFFLKPVLASIFAMLLLGEQINSFMIIGSVLILIGLVVTVASRKQTS